MPQIAQQDYLRPSGKSIKDCHLLAAFAHSIAHGTIFDVIFSYEGDYGLVENRIINKDRHNNLFFMDTDDRSHKTIYVIYTQTQYEGLAAIQDADNSYTSVPVLETDSDGYLFAIVDNDKLVTVGGKKLAVTVSDDDTIAALAISNDEYSGFEITWEDAQKLIGLPIS